MNKSREKGIRAELKLRDEFRRLGYESNRIPLSGAMEGYKGDVTFTKDGKTLTAEVKCRKSNFKLFYDYLNSFKTPREGFILEPNKVGSVLCVMSLSLDDVLDNTIGWFGSGATPLALKVINKLKTSQKWIQGCDILCVKDDRKPFIYIRYYV